MRREYDQNLFRPDLSDQEEEVRRMAAEMGVDITDRPIQIRQFERNQTFDDLAALRAEMGLEESSEPEE